MSKLNLNALKSNSTNIIGNSEFKSDNTDTWTQTQKIKENISSIPKKKFSLKELNITWNSTKKNEVKENEKQKQAEEITEEVTEEIKVNSKTSTSQEEISPKDKVW
jgi:hypothetical protein